MMPGAIRNSRTGQLTGNPERVQNNHQSHKLHGADTDPWAISDWESTKLCTGGRLEVQGHGKDSKQLSKSL
jgi:hypothetical protein